MAGQIKKCNMDNTLLFQSAFNVNGLKEEYKDDNLTDDKISISKTAIFIDNAKLQDSLIYDKMKLRDISTTVDTVKTELPLTEIQYNVVCDNIKIEEGINTDDIKTELSNGLLYCEDCHVFFEDYCTKCDMLVHILNRIAPINANGNITRAELPNNNILEIRDSFEESHIFALKVIPVGVKFGPVTGLNRKEHPWKIKAGKFVVTGDKSPYLNWMQYINPARNISEQNLLVFQHGDNLYYQSSCQIQEGDELLVYFGEEYEYSLNKNVEMDFIPTSEYTFKEAFACIFCCLGFSSKSYLAKHKAICPGNVDGGFSVEELVRCPSCKINFAQKEYILHHMPYCCKINDRKRIQSTTGYRTAEVIKRKTRPRQIHKCQQCNYKTKYKGDLQKHTNQHYEVKTYKCGVCCNRFKTKEVLRLHVENIHVCPDGNDDLEHSTEVYMKEDIKAEHSCSLNEIKQLQCLKCEFRTKCKRNFRRHLAEKHLKKCTYKCNACDYKASQMYQLKIHIGTRHLQEFKYKCDICDYKTNRKSELKVHIGARHLKEFRYKCDTCDYKAYWKSILKSHIERKHLREFYYKCDACNYKTHVKSNLKKHKMITHSKFNNKCYKCDLCDYKAKLKSHLRIHIEVRHLKEFKYKCDACDYKANLKYQLKSHIETIHLKEFKYKCDSCEYKTNRKSDLEAHVETRHLKEFKYKCETCDYKANRKSQLKTHIQTTHLKEFKYKCETCDYKTNRRATLKIHVERIHLKEFKYKCDTCDYKSSTKTNLVVHVKSKHLK